MAPHRSEQTTISRNAAHGAWQVVPEKLDTVAQSLR